MKEVVSTITSKGQVTVPVEVRRLLKLRPKDKIAFVIEDGQVRLAPPSYTLDSAFGAVKPLKRPEDFDALTERAWEDQVHDGAGRRKA